MSDIDQVIDDVDGARRRVLEYARVVSDLVVAAKEPEFGPDGWAPLAELVDVDAFVRVGNFKEVMNWQQYISFLTDWAGSAEWECSFTRISEANGIVFLELEERSRMGDFANTVNSMSVYAFDDGGKISRIDVYLQMELPSPELLAGLVGADASRGAEPTATVD